MNIRLICLLVVFSPILAFAEADTSYPDHEINQLETYFEEDLSGRPIPKEFKNEAEASRFGCLIGNIKHISHTLPPTKSCVYHTTAFKKDVGDVILVVIYDALKSGTFVRRHFFTRYMKYHKANISCLNVFYDGQQFLLVEHDGGTGTGFGEVVFELIGWNGKKLTTVFQHVKSCFLRNPTLHADLNVKPMIFIPPDQVEAIPGDRFPATQLILTYTIRMTVPNYYTSYYRDVYPGSEAGVPHMPDDTFTGKWGENYIWDEAMFSFKKDDRHPSLDTLSAQIQTFLLTACQ